MTHVEHDAESRAQARVARKYKTLGYDVTENPRPELLPDFMHGVTPDIVARSTGDNVVIEVKRNGTLKGSNDLVNITERISGHPGWRFELVVIKDGEEHQAGSDEASHERLLGNLRVATGAKLFDLAHIYLANMLGEAARDLAEQNGVSSKNKTDQSLLLDLAFKGVLPQDVLNECLDALSTRNTLLHHAGKTAHPSEDDITGLLQLYEQLRALQ